MPLSVTNIVYHDVLDSTADPDPVSSQTDKEDHVLKLIWATSSSFSHDFLNDTLTLDEEIIKDMNVSNRTWDDMCHHSYFLSDLVRIE